MIIESNFDYSEKIILLGQSAVGKTNLIIRFTENKFYAEFISTIGFDYKSKIISLNNSKKNLKLFLYDTAGQERHEALCKSLYKKVDGIILVYDITSRESFDYIPKWVKEIKQYNENFSMMLIGNKIDDEENRIISFEEGKKFADDNNMVFFETSAKNGDNVNKAFIYYGNKLIENLIEKKVNISLSTKSHTKKQKKKCC